VLGLVPLRYLLPPLELTSQTGESSGIYSLLHQSNTPVRCKSTFSLPVMGCWCSKEDPEYKPLWKLFSRSRVASNDERPLPSGPQQSVPGASFTSPSGQRPPELRVPGVQRRHSGPPASARQAPQRASQRTAEARSSHNLGRSPNTATPSVPYSEGVLGELEKLRSSVVDFVDRCFSQPNESLRSKARRTIYKLVLENAERHMNSQSRKCNI